jgi:GTPase
MSTTASPRPRAVLLGVQLTGVTDAELASSLDELARLATTLGFDVVGRVTQRRARLAPSAAIGSGKLRELAQWTGGSGVVPIGPRRTRKSAGDYDDAPLEVSLSLADADGDGSPSKLAESGAWADAGRTDGEAQAETPEDGSGTSEPRATLVLVDHELSPSQARNLERATGTEVLDRTAVILAIFQRHARSREARLQVEIARLEYIAPRLRETGGGRDREGGGIGGRGAGESGHELDRRKVRDRIAELRAELAVIERSSETQRKRREGVATVALVGYTNAGKSSWMRALTSSDVLVEDKLFATLGTTVRTLQPEGATRILVSDTVGFIKHLPHDLVASFRSTLDEARACDLLVHLVDASDPAHASQIQVTREVLASIGADTSPSILVFNKADRLDALARARIAAAHPEALLVSAKSPADLMRLREHLVAHFERDMQEADLVIPYALQRLVAYAHASGHVLCERHEADGTHLRVRVSAPTLARLRAELG